MEKKEHYTVLVAGSTAHTAMCAQTLREDDRFSIVGVITPPPKPVGRKQVMTPSAFAQWASERIIPQIIVEKKIDKNVQEKIITLCQTVPTGRPDFLLVVDFGYIIPTWLLEFPTVAAINIHPSALPRWRGSSPAQFSLLYGEVETAVSIMTMTAGLDEGPILKQIPFTTQTHWTQTEYYLHAFQLASKALPEQLHGLASESCVAVPQPDQSPTPIAKRLKKTDSFISWKDLQQALEGEKPQLELSSSDKTNAILDTQKTSPLLLQAYHNSENPSWAQTIENAIRAFSPWPKIWTSIPTKKGEKRMVIESAQVKNGKLKLGVVIIEGLAPNNWMSMQSLLL